MNDEGSIAPLAILGVMLSLVLGLVVISADQVFQQQRSLNTVSDSLALDLADLKLQPKTKLDFAMAVGELAQLSQGLHGPAVSLAQFWQPSESRVSVRICQQNRLRWLPLTGLLSKSTLPDVCVTSVAENR